MHMSDTNLYCFELVLEHGESYHERIIFAGSLAAAIVIAYRISVKDTRITIKEHQPTMVDGDGTTLDDTFAGGASFGPLFEATHMGFALDIQEAREHIMFRYTHRWTPSIEWTAAPNPGGSK